MLVTDDGMVMSVRATHCIKLLSPILLTDDGMVMSVRVPHSEKQ